MDRCRDPSGVSRDPGGRTPISSFLVQVRVAPTVSTRRGWGGLEGRRSRRRREVGVPRFVGVLRRPVGGSDGGRSPSTGTSRLVP